MNERADAGFSPAWREWRAGVDLDEYETRWDRLAAGGQHVHGEAEFIAALAPSSVLDAGCGMGRVGIELARRSIDVAGVDLDADLLERARRRAPCLEWIECDLADVAISRVFDVVALAGNVLPFVAVDRRAAVVANCARHLAPGGRLVMGAGLRPGWPTVAELDDWCGGAGLRLVERYAGWLREPWSDTGRANYAVSVHARRPPVVGETRLRPLRLAAGTTRVLRLGDEELLKQAE